MGNTGPLAPPTDRGGPRVAVGAARRGRGPLAAGSTPVAVLPLRGRAWRRHHRARLQRARRWFWQRDLRREPKYLGQVVTTPCVCSCWLCRPRKHGGASRQERRIQAAWRELTHGDGG